MPDEPADEPADATGYEPADAEATPEEPGTEGRGAPSGPGASSGPSASSGPEAPNYKGAPLDAERGPGLGCFWIQVVLFVALMVLTPLSVVWSWDSRISAVLLIVTLGLLFFVGQTTIFLLRLVAADRRSQRRPLAASARKTVGQLEEEADAESKKDDAGSGESPPLT